MDYAAVDAGLEPTRNEFLALTSEIRSGLERFEQAQDTGAAHRLSTTSAALMDVSTRLGHAPLERWSQALCRMTRIATSLLPQKPPGALELLAGVDEIVGLLERGLDCHLDGSQTQQLTALEGAVRGKIPVAWQAWIDDDDQAFAARLTALQPPAPAAAPPPPVAATMPVAAIAEPIDDSEDAAFQRELREAFLTEVTEGFERCEELLVRFERQPEDRETLNALFRQFHTLKGAAGAVELTEAAEQLHQGESLLQALRDGEVEVDSSALVDFLLRLGDSVKAIIDVSCGRKPTSCVVLSDIAGEITHLLEGTTPAAASPQPDLRTTATATPNTAAASPSDAAFDPLPALNALRQKAASGKLDPELLLVIDALDQRARHFSQMAASLQEEVKHLRTVPMEDLLRRLQRPVRDAARQEGKFVDLLVQGGELRVDRAVAERLSGPLLHLVRNAVAHGIEAPALREARGKSRTGTLLVNAIQHGHDLVISIDDDGNGLDFDAIRHKAMAHGWVGADGAASRDQLAQFIFRPGFSTREDVNEIAGRGVGMDVVAREIESLHGRVDVTSRDGAGTSFRITVPSLAMPEGQA